MDTENTDSLERLKKQMREAGLSSAELARKMGVARQQTYRWINGLQEMNLKRWEEAAQHLNVHPAALLWGHDTPAFDEDKLVRVLTDIQQTADDKGVQLTPSQTMRIAVETYKSDANIKFLVDLVST